MATNASGEFEKALERLEEIVGKLEKENPSLDESVALYREGKELAAKCETLLGDAQRAIEGVQQSTNGAAAARNTNANTAPSSLFGDAGPRS